MSNTPIFDEVLSEYSKMHLVSATVFPWPKHPATCPFDGYNVLSCNCGAWRDEPVLPIAPPSV